MRRHSHLFLALARAHSYLQQIANDGNDGTVILKITSAMSFAIQDTVVLIPEIQHCPENKVQMRRPVSNKDDLSYNTGKRHPLSDT